jgi:hypothetical protein
MKNLLFVVLICFSSTLKGQFTDSNLPIVVISTGNNSAIPDQPRVLATMKIIYRGPGQRNYVSDQHDVSRLNYNGKIKIEIRGSSSQALPKKQYGLTTVQNDNITNNNVSLLGMPKENDWVLNGLAFDPSLMRDYIGYNLSLHIGNYAPRQRYCEVIINEAYVGLYILQEKVKIDKNRVDILKIDATDNALPNLSGGYLVKADKVTPEDPSAWTMPTYLGTTVDFIHESPKPGVITPLQHSYISYEFSRLAFSVNNTSISNGYPSVIDIPSFVDFMLVNELAANVDAYQFSTFFHKDRNGKLRAGPLWDLNLTFGNDLFMWGLDRSKTYTWQFDNNDNVGPRFWRDLYNNATFRCYLSRRWNELIAPGQPLNQESIATFIDHTVESISEAIERESQRWGTVGNHNAHIAAIKTFITERITWMSTNLGSYTACSNVPTPPLVITRIHYHPKASPTFPDENDLEFIEITNTGDDAVPLTGLYFRGTGFVYSFPDGASLPAHGVIQLANNKRVFTRKHGYIPYGEFTRNLSNATQKITLADAYGNVIDEVEYADTAPWPDADGNGLHLKLADVSSDNNIGSNWIATDETISSTEIILSTGKAEQIAIDLYPNPSENTVVISAAQVIDEFTLKDAQGRVVATGIINNTSFTLDLSDSAPGLYLLTLESNGMHIVRKIMRK